MQDVIGYSNNDAVLQSLDGLVEDVAGTQRKDCQLGC